jgi:hypothetical protein
MRTKEYELRLYDETLVTFEFIETQTATFGVEIISCREDMRGVMPPELKIGAASELRQFLKSRVIPQGRAYVSEILASLGIAVGDTIGIINACMGLSLNDSYWIVPKGFSGKFADYNLYENRLPDVLALVALTGIPSPGDMGSSVSLELTTNGNLPKAWMYTESDGMCLYKAGQTGYEPYSEYYSYQIAEAMGIDAVRYELTEYKGVLTSKCRLFTDIDTAFVPIGRVLSGRSLDAVLEYYKNISAADLSKLKDMFAFDCIITNIDRHFGNFGVLRENKTGEVKGIAPIFDNGLSLYSNIINLNKNDLPLYERVRTPFETTFSYLAGMTIGPVQADRIDALTNFTFKRHKEHNISEERLLIIEARIREKARLYLKAYGGKHHTYQDASVPQKTKPKTR